jgi:chromosomal replication initiation ATPase DnaA
MMDLERDALERVRGDCGAASLVADLVALATDVPRAEIGGGKSRGSAATRARQMAMYLAYVIFQWPLDRVGAAFGRDRTTAGHACRQIEDMRDDRRFDDMMERLEACLRMSPCAPGWNREDWR